MSENYSPGPTGEPITFSGGLDTIQTPQDLAAHIATNPDAYHPDLVPHVEAYLQREGVTVPLQTIDGLDIQQQQLDQTRVQAQEQPQPGLDIQLTSAAPLEVATTQRLLETKQTVPDVHSEPTNLTKIERTAVAEQREAVTGMQVDVILGEFKPKKRDPWDDFSTEKEQRAEEQNFRASLQKVLNELSVQDVASNPDISTQIIAKYIEQSGSDYRALEVLAAQGYGGQLMQVALSLPNAPLSVNSVFIAVNNPVDARLQERDLQSVQIKATRLALEAVEKIGIKTLEPTDRQDYIRTKFQIAWEQAQISGQSEKEITTQISTELSPALNEDDILYADFVILEHKSESLIEASQEDREQIAQEAKKLLNSLQNVEQNDPEGVVYQSVGDIKYGLLTIAESLKDSTLIEAVLTDFKPDEVQKISYLLKDLAAQGHIEQVVRLLETSTEFSSRPMHAMDVLRIATQQKNLQLTERAFQVLRTDVAPKNTNGHDQYEYASESIISETVLNLLNEGYTKQALELLADNPKIKIHYDRLISYNSQNKETVPQVIESLLDQNNPQAETALVELISRVYLYKQEYIDEFSALIKTNEKLLRVCDHITQTHLQNLLQVSDQDQLQPAFVALLQFSHVSGRPLSEDVLRVISSDFIQHLIELKAKQSIDSATVSNIVQQVVDRLDPNIGSILRYVDKNNSEERLKTLLSFGSLQEAVEALAAIPLEDHQKDQLLRLMGCNEVYDAFAKNILRNHPKDIKVLKSLFDSQQYDVSEYYITGLYLEMNLSHNELHEVYGLSREFMLELMNGELDLRFVAESILKIREVADETHMYIDPKTIEEILHRQNPEQAVESFVQNSRLFTRQLDDAFITENQNSHIGQSMQQLTGKLLEQVVVSENPQQTFEVIIQNKDSLGLLNEYLPIFLRSNELQQELVSRLATPGADEHFKQLHQTLVENKDLLESLNDPTNVLYEFREAFFSQLIVSSDKPAVITQLRRVFMSDELPSWAKLYTLVSIRYAYLAEGLGASGQTDIVYPISKIPLLKQNLGETVDPLLATDDQIVMRDLTSLSAQDLKRFLIEMPDDSIQRLVGNSIPFNEIKTEYRMQIFAHYLRDAIERSVGAEYKQLADQRNRELVHDIIQVDAGTLLHGSSISVLPKMLGLGNLCGEALEFGHKLDSTPLQADFALFAGDSLAIGEDAVDLMGRTEQAKYGDFTIMFKRTEGTKDDSVIHNYGPWKDNGQVLVPGGIAATEIVGIYFKDGIERTSQYGGQPIAIQTIKRQIVRNGFYIPMYDKSGELLFTPQEFDKMKERLLDTESRQRHIEAMQNSLAISPREFVDVLSDDPALEKEFAASSGVSEGYSLREHTEAILGQFEKNFAATYESPLLSRGAFRTMLALHDIGKAQAVKYAGSTAAQHSYTVAMVQDKAVSLGMSERESTIMTTLLEHDYLGELVKNRATPEQTAEFVKEMAMALDAQPSQVLDLLETYYLCDASSYTDNASYSSNSGLQQITAIPSINFVFDFSGSTIQLNQKNRDVMARLRSLIA